MKGGQASDLGPMTRRVIYHGQVQGVGFRATTHHLAGGFRVDGFVRNLPDGTVELVAQGEAGEVAGLLAAVAERFAGYIERAEEKPATQDFSGKGFTIRY
jgi:acylphosphatase